MKRKEPWWGYVKSIIREYPQLKQELETPLEPFISSGFGGGGSNRGTVNSPVERCVLHDIAPRKQKKLEAVETAIRVTKVRHPESWEDRLKVVDLVYWKKTKTVVGAAMEIPCHQNTAGAWQAEFIRIVAEELELP